MNAYLYPYQSQIAQASCSTACNNACPDLFCPDVAAKRNATFLVNAPMQTNGDTARINVYNDFTSTYQSSTNEMRTKALEATYARYNQPTVVFASGGANLVRSRPKYDLDYKRSTEVTFPASNGQIFNSTQDQTLWKTATRSRARLIRSKFANLDK